MVILVLNMFPLLPFFFFSYCMEVNLQWIPEDWICESCLSNNIVSPEASRKIDTIRTMPLDSPDVVCHESIHTLDPSSQGRASSRRQKTIETGKVKFIPTEEVIRLSTRATEKGNPLRVKVHDSVGPSGLVKFPRHGGVHSMTNQQAPQALKKLEGDNFFFVFFQDSSFTSVVVG